MRSFAVAALAAAVALASPSVRCAEIAIRLDDGAQNAVAQLPSLLDSCVAGLTLRGDAAVCRSVANFLVALGNEVKSAQTVASKAADDAAKKAAADKAASDVAPATAAPAQ
jgi:hypothetical protein